jgi:hypothetical protein
VDGLSDGAPLKDGDSEGESLGCSGSVGVNDGSEEVDGKSLGCELGL